MLTRSQESTLRERLLEMDILDLDGNNGETVNRLHDALRERHDLAGGSAVIFALPTISMIPQ